MSDYAPNHTARLKLRYRVAATFHTMTLRSRGNGPVDEDSSALMGDLNNWLNVIEESLFNDFTIISARWAAKDSDIFLPIPMISWTFVPSGGAPTPGDKPQFGSFQGVTRLGNRASILLFGVVWQGDSVVTGQSDYRLTGEELPAIETVVNQMNLSESMVGIDLADVIWYPYFNLGYHGHWQRKARG